MSSLWQNICVTALLGTERGQLEESTLQRLQSIGIQTSNDLPKVILEAACLYSRMHKAGIQLQELEGELYPICPEEEKKPCSLKVSQQLAMILSGTFKDALEEFLKLLAKHRTKLPEEHLPALFEYCIRKPAFKDLLKLTMGERGRWLVNQNPHWQYLQDKVIEDVWEVGDSQDRLQFLKNLRRTDVVKAIGFLESTWVTESVSDKEDFIKALERDLSKTDEQFLENCLEDRRKKIRKIAVKLSAKIEDSALINRTFNRVVKLIEIKQRGDDRIRFNISLPESCTPEMVRDGIDPRSQWFRGGLKASRLGQMVAMIPPKRWRIYFDKSAKECLEIFIRSEWGELLVQAAIEAAALHRDEEAMESILLFWFNNKDHDRWQNLNVSVLFTQLTTKLFNKIAIAAFRRNKNSLSENQPITKFLKAGDYNWSDELMVLFIHDFLKFTSKSNSFYWNGWHYLGILKKSAYRCNARLYPKMSGLLEREVGASSSWSKDVEEFLGIVQFRNSMEKELRVES